MNRRRFGLVSAVFLIASLAGCAVESYDKPVKSFDEAVRAAARSLADYDEALTEAVRDLRRRDALRSPATVAVNRTADGAECLSRSQRCRIVLPAGGAGGSPRWLSPESHAPRVLALMDDMSGYAGALSDIVASQSRAQAESALTAAGSHLEGLIRHTEAQDLAPFGTPLAAALGWAAGVTIDAVRYRALQEATKAADPIVARTAQVLADTARVVEAGLRGPLGGDVAAKIDAFKAAPSGSRLDALLEAAERYDAVLTAKPSPVFQKLAASHADLTRALNTREISLVAVQRQIDGLKDEIDKLQSVARALKKARAAQQGASP